MTALSSQPTSHNFLSPLGFQLIVRKLPNTIFFLQKVNVPGLVLNPAINDTPFVEIHQTGDHIMYDDLQITFKVNENLSNYVELYDWIKGLGFPNDWTEYEELEKKPKISSLGLKSDINLLLLDSQMNPKISVNFIQCSPTGLGGLYFDTTQTDVNYITTEASFKYNSYSIEVIR